MRHSIIIPHRNRNDYLDVCLWSVLRSIDASHAEGVEVLVIDHGSDEVPVSDDERVRVLVDPRPMPSGEIVTKIGTRMRYENAFCKARLLNYGLDHAEGEVVTVLDADAIVGPRWASCVDVLECPPVCRVAYRVRYLDKRMLPVIYGGVRDMIVDHCFEHYEEYPQAWEAYGQPQIDNKDRKAGEPWGNSQFSMRREDLDGLRYDENYVGKGLEDIDFNRRVYERFGASFRGVIFTQPEYAMFHIRHDYERRTWGDNAFQIANADRYGRQWPPLAGVVSKQ